MKLRRIAIETAAGLLGGALYAAALAGPCGSLCWLALVPWAILYGRPGSRTRIAAAASATSSRPPVCHAIVVVIGGSGWRAVPVTATSAATSRTPRAAVCR